MKNIKKYFLPVDFIEKQSIYLPKNSEICSARYYSDNSIMLSVIVNPMESDMELRIFKLYTFDENIYDNNLNYVASFKEFPDYFLFEVV